MNTFKSLNAVKYDRQSVGNAIDFLKNGRLPQFANQSALYRFKRKWKNFIVEGDHLYHAGLKVVPVEDIKTTLQKMYDDSAVGSGIGRDKFYDKVKRAFIGITKEAVMKFLDNQESYQLNKPYLRNKVVKPIISSRKNQRWAMDLMVLIKQKGQNNGYQYIFAVIDTFTKFVWAVPLKDKGAETVADALTQVILISGNHPSLLQSDNGSEFKNKEMDKVMERFDVKQVFSLPYTPQSNGIIENWNKYAKSALRLHFIKTGKKQWIHELNNIVYNWNTSKHGTTEEVPSDLADEEDIEVLSEVKARIRSQAEKILGTQNKLPPIKVGEYVRVSRGSTRDGRRDKWEKLGPNWSKALFKVVSVSEDGELTKARYALENEAGERVSKQYYRDDLQQVDKADLVKDAGTKAVKKPRVSVRVEVEAAPAPVEVVNEPVLTRAQRKAQKSAATPESLAKKITEGITRKKLLQAVANNPEILNDEAPARRTRSQVRK